VSLLYGYHQLRLVVVHLIKYFSKAGYKFLADAIIFIFDHPWGGEKF